MFLKRAHLPTQMDYSFNIFANCKWTNKQVCCATLLRVYFTFNNEHETLRFGLSTENGHICIARQEFVLLAARDIFPDSGRKSRDVCRTAGDVGRRRQRAPVNAHFRCCSFCRGASPFIGQGRQAGRSGRTDSVNVTARGNLWTIN